MEEKKGSAGESKPSITDELFGRKDAAGILGAVLSPPAGVSTDVGRVGKDSLGSEIESSKKQATTEGQAWNTQSVTADAKAQGCSSKGQNVPYKDKYCIEATMDTSSLGSSLYYGGPDVCADFSSYPTKKDDEDDPENADMASRGNWWQGSLYY